MYMAFYQDEDEESREKTDRMAHPIAERLDLVMTVMFSYIKDFCYVNGNRPFAFRLGSLSLTLWLIVRM